MTAATLLPSNGEYRAELIPQPDGSEVWLVNGAEVEEFEPGDPTAVARFNTVKNEFWRLERQKLGDLYDQCQLLLMIRAERLYIAAGYTSFRDCATGEFGIDGRYAEQLSECAGDYSREQFLQYGPALAILGLQYLRATPEHDTTADLPTTLLRYGPGAGKLFPQASTREVREESRGIREENKPSYKQIVPPKLTETTRLLSERVKRARFRLKNFKSGDDVVTGLVIELPDASREDLIRQFAHMLAALGPVE